MRIHERSTATKCEQAQCDFCGKVMHECLIVDVVYNGHDASACCECRDRDPEDEKCRVCDPAGWAESDAYNLAHGFAPYAIP